jgi:hypothetical protein
MEVTGRESLVGLPAVLRHKLLQVQSALGLSRSFKHVHCLKFATFRDVETSQSGTTPSHTSLLPDCHRQRQKPVRILVSRQRTV